MKTKNFLAAGIAGGIVNFLLGWLFFGIIFKDTFPQPDESANSMLLIALGSLTFGLFIAYIFVKWAQISTVTTGFKAGAVIGFFTELTFDFFYMAMNPDATFQLAALDVVLTIVIGAVVGAIIAVVNGKMG